MKLHIGTGNTYLPGWTNVDVFSFVEADLYANAMALPYNRESCVLIYASHVLEHFNRHLVLAVLSHWRDLLKPKGRLRLSVPDFDAVVKVYKKTGSLQSVIGLLYGGQKHQMNTHYIIFNRETLSIALNQVGFTEIRKWDWKETEHKYHDDYSQAYLPHMDKGKGIQMSLNLEATK